MRQEELKFATAGRIRGRLKKKDLTLYDEDKEINANDTDWEDPYEVMQVFQNIFEALSEGEAAMRSIDRVAVQPVLRWNYQTRTSEASKDFVVYLIGRNGKGVVLWVDGETNKVYSVQIGYYGGQSTFFPVWHLKATIKEGG